MKTYFTLIIFSLLIIESNCQTPDWVWARSAVSADSSGNSCFDIATDDSGNIYLTGEYHDTIAFGTDTLTGSLAHVYLAKYDSSGNVKWAKNNLATAYSIVFGYGVSTDAFDNCY